MAYIAKPILERFFAKVEGFGTIGCWNWIGPKDEHGYGVFNVGDNKTVRAQRFMYEFMTKTQIPDGLVTDHLCRNTSCVNPNHLEPVTNAENVRRGFSPSATGARRSDCKQGHLFVGDNLVIRNGQRVCRICERAKALRYYYKTRKLKKSGALNGK